MNTTQCRIEYIGQDVAYTTALKRQEAAVAHCLQTGAETLFLAEHAPVFTLGSSAQPADVLDAGSVPVVTTGRGGQVTYHGPGQRVVYPILNLNTRTKDVRWYVRTLQHWIIDILATYNIEGHITDDVGVWVDDAKIAAIGIRVRKWVTFHGFALNVTPDLTMYQRIIPCGLADKPVTSMQQLGASVTFEALDQTILHTNPFT